MRNHMDTDVSVVRGVFRPQCSHGQFWGISLIVKLMNDTHRKPERNRHFPPRVFEVFMRQKLYTHSQEGLKTASKTVAIS